MSNNPHIVAYGQTLKNYTISKCGEVWSLISKKYLKYADNVYYYLVIRDNDGIRRNYAIHVIMAHTYIPNPDNLPVVNHINGDKHDNRVENLEWVSYSRNSVHAYFLGLRTSTCKIVVQLDLDGNILAEYKSVKDAASSTGVVESTISNICRGKDIPNCKHKFIYKDNLDNITKKVHKIDPKTYKISSTYDNVEEIAKEFCIPVNLVFRYCNNPFVEFKGFLWQYVSDNDKNNPLFRPDFKDGTYKRVKLGGKYSNDYYIRKDGKVWSRNQHCFLKPKINTGYYDITLHFEKKRYTVRIHRKVAESFIPNPYKYTIVNHKNGNKLDNRVENLEWCTSRQNSQHAHDNGLVNVYKRPVVQYDMDGNKIAEYASATSAGIATKIRRSDISATCRRIQLSSGGYIWKYKEDENNVISGPLELQYKRKAVVKFDMKCNKICEYHSTKEAAKEFGCHPDNIAAACRGVVESSNGFIWRYKKNEHTVKPKTKIHHNRKIIEQYDSDGNFIQKYDSINAAAKTLNINASGIQKCCAGNQDTYEGFIWCYQGDEFIILETKVVSSRAKRVAKYDKDTGEKLQEYESASAAAKDVNTSPHNISDACTGKSKTSCGFVWKYV